MKKTLMRATPESCGLSSRRLMEMVKAMEKSGTELHGLMIARHGRVLLEGWWLPYTSDTVHICHSFGKSYVATAVGVACTQGMLSVEDRIADIFRDDLKAFGVKDEGNLAKLRVRHVLTMANGMSVHALGGKDLVRNYLTTEVDLEPGSVFLYNTAGSCMLGEIVRRVTGRSVYDYMKENVFEPIGFDTEHFYWMQFDNGLHAAPGVAACTENNLRLGLLYLQNGVWDGKRIIDEEWMRQATTKRIDNGGAGYGYQLWMYGQPDTFFFSGGHGQECIMSRPHDMVVALNQACCDPHDSDAVHRILDEYLFGETHPETLPEDPEALAELKAYLASREIPQPGSSPAHGFDRGWEGVYTVAEGRFHLQPELRPWGELNVNDDFYTHHEPYVHTITIRRSDEGFTLTTDGEPPIPVRTDGRWVPAPVQCEMPAYKYSCAAARFEGDRLIVDQWFYQTCFKTRLCFTRDGDSVHLDIRKERLHEEHPYIHMSAELKFTP